MNNLESVKTVKLFPNGVITPPPSKSLSHRALICGALACIFGDESAVCRIKNIGSSKDILATMESLKALGADITIEGNIAIIKKGTADAKNFIDCFESGSTLRFLIPVTALYQKRFEFTGHGRLMQRPLDAYQNIFDKQGLEFKLEGEILKVSGPLKNGVYELDGNVSSQYVTGLLFALPLLKGDSEIRLTSSLESRKYVDLTLDVLEHFGIKIIQKSTGFLIPGGQSYKPMDYTVEADYSQAAFFIASGVLGLPVSLKGLNLNSKQGDLDMISVVKAMGARIDTVDDIISFKPSNLNGVEVDAREIPDIIPPIAVLCCFCKGESRIINAGRLRFKESDRLTAITTELNKLGADIQEYADSLVIKGKKSLKGGVVDAHNDHRIAMSLAVAAIKCDNAVTIHGSDSVQKSYPTFWDDFEKGCRNV